MLCTHTHRERERERERHESYKDYGKSGPKVIFKFRRIPVHNKHILTLKGVFCLTTFIHSYQHRKWIIRCHSYYDSFPSTRFDTSSSDIAQYVRDHRMSTQATVKNGMLHLISERGKKRNNQHLGSRFLTAGKPRVDRGLHTREKKT